MKNRFLCAVCGVRVARAARRMLGAVLVLALTGCAVGPTYRSPPPPATKAYTATPVATTLAPAAAASGAVAGGQHLEYGGAVDAEWWKDFGSSDLDQLVAQALRHNPDLAAAQATLEQARYNLKAAQGVFYPQVSLGLAGERTRTSGAASGGAAGSQLYNLYTGQVSVSYYPDVFGLNRLVTRGEQAQVDVARDQLAAARLTIEGNVVNTALDLAALNEEVAATEQTISDQRQILDLARTQYRLGAASQFDVLTQDSQLAASEARLSQLEQARDAARHLLATYLGEFPSESGDLHALALGDLHLPATLPVSLPSTLVRERPDIRAAEAQLRAANAQVGEAVARTYPNLELTGNFGDQSNNGGQLFDPASRIWNLAASLVLPLFEGGALQAKEHAAEAAYRAVFANYQSTVLGAFRNVADVLRALQHDSAALDAEGRALQSAQQAFALVRIQYQSGAVDYLSLLTSEMQYQNARIAYVQAQAQRFADTAALYLVLGGGAWASSSDERVCGEQQCASN
ncbi:MAG TPA: efflux transporter outer membrane subunit [Gammaproteobacteria bacterium]|nr:efflux transporter outer membrane subunit [Gammaproteobacteria bacterium]